MPNLPIVPDMPDHSDTAIIDAMTEMERQVGKFGEQNRPSFCALPVEPRQRTGVYGIPSADFAKARTDGHARTGILTWADIALEEVCEAFEEPEGSEALYVELIQCSAVFASWAANVKRNAK